MKLHLPVSLFKSLLVAMGVACSVTEASIMHRDASIVTYTDFGQNTGRYVVGDKVNSLLSYIRSQEGVTISYIGGQPTYTLEHGMIDFGSAYTESTNAAISPTAVVTVAHNWTCSDDFTGHVYEIGSQHAIQYKAIEHSSSSVFVHNLKNDKGVTDADLQDHRVTRLSKVITDAPYVGIYDAASKGLSGLTYYHTGAGTQRVANYATGHGNLSTTYISDSYQFATGGITTSGWVWKSGSGTNKGVLSTVSFATAGISESNPLPWTSEPGDSGSPLYVWDAESQTYQYIASCRGNISGSYLGSAFIMDTSYDKQTVDSFTKKVDMSTASTVYLNAVVNEGETRTDGTYTTTIWSGTVSSDAAGENALKSFNGVKNGLNTWSNLAALKYVQTWYSYDQSYVQASIEDLFYTENLSFSSSAEKNSIVLIVIP